MFESPDSPYLVPFDGSFQLKDRKNLPNDKLLNKKKNKSKLADNVEELADLQRVLYAHDHHAILLVFQAMDAAGKDGTIRAVLSGVNPVGCQVSSFKQPSKEELDHDFMWRTTKALPERGRIGVFNRSYYEEVLVVRVHPEYLGGQNIPSHLVNHNLWQERFESINDHEKHLARNGTIILKFFLNVSKEEQRQRFLARLEEPEKNWKFSTGDVAERQLWDKYMEAYQDALNHTSKPWAPWFCIPADDKPYMRRAVSEIILDTMKQLNLEYPEPTEKERAKFTEMEKLLRSEKR